MGPCSRVFKTSKARVPWRLSFFVFAITTTPLDIYRTRMPPFDDRVKLLWKLPESQRSVRLYRLRNNAFPKTLDFEMRWVATLAMHE
jgi:hypothetical protein